MDNGRLLLENGYPLTDHQLEQFSRYCELLREWNGKFNLTAITDPRQIYIRHFLDCLLLTEYELKGTLCDIGSGAGFPGVVLKIACPELAVTLLEPNNKKVRFLNELTSQLALEGITALPVRAEEYAHEHFQQADYAVSRAVAPLNILVELALPSVKTGGHFLAAKGPKASEEIALAAHGIELLGGTISSAREFRLPDGSVRVIIDILKTAPTNPKYPRQYGQIKKKPL